MTDPAVIARGLAKTYFDEGRGEVRAVRGIDFQCAAGEIFGLLGANGAGKTTTLRMLATLLRPTAGSAEIMGHSVTGASRRVRQQLGYLSASTGLHERLSARETLRLFAEINGFPREKLDARVRDLIDRFELGEIAEARVGKLSSGQRQKVAIARAVAHDPPVLIFDEPTTSLDVLGVLGFHEALHALRDEGRCIVLSTHVMSEAEKLCDRIAIVHRGQVLACDTLEGLRTTTGLRYLEDIFVQLIGEQE